MDSTEETVLKETRDLLLEATEDGFTREVGYTFDEVTGDLIATFYDDEGEPAGEYLVEISLRRK